MINNRQAGRRRGRNIPRQGGGGNRGSGDSGNRIDNRARGNAAQLLEKYRNLARDAQLAGDRVNAEYYFQFADHYFRVLADNRARQEEHQARFRRPDEGDQDGADMGDEGEERAEDSEYGAGEDQAPQGRRHDEGRERRPRDRDRGHDGRRDREERGRRPRVANDDSDGEGRDEGMISMAALPPAIGRSEESASAPADEVEAPEAAPAKPRRGRPPRRPAEAAE